MQTAGFSYRSLPLIPLPKAPILGSQGGEKLDIQVETTGSKGRYFTMIEGASRDRELTFSIASAQMIIADHDGVPEEFKGQGTGKALNAPGGRCAP